MAEPYAATTTVETRPIPFAELGVPEPLLRVLAADGKTEAFPIQADTLPDSLSGRDILGRGRTGSGKTLAFCIPLAARLCEAPWQTGMTMTAYRRGLKAVKAQRLEERRADDFLPHPRGLVLAPTRELANQINDVLVPLAQMAGITTTTVYGGVRYNRQIRDLKSGADIVVACPGRLEDLLHQNALTLSDVQIIILDEADEMADMGFLPPVKRILEQIRPDAQHMLFSATLDHGIDDLVREFLRNPKTHSVAEPADAADLMSQHVFNIDRDDKNAVVHALASGAGRRILFTRTKYQAKNLAKKLTQSGIPAAELHGNLTQNQRDRNLAAFEDGDVNVMVATDVAARGIDVSNVELVVQVDPPADPKSFVHRSGRTARAGRSGDVVTLVLPDQRREARRMLKAAGISVRPIAVRHDSPEVLELIGDVAESVEGWSLDQTQPAGNPRKRKGRNGKAANKTADMADDRGARRRTNKTKALRHLPSQDADARIDTDTALTDSADSIDSTHSAESADSPRHAVTAVSPSSQSRGRKPRGKAGQRRAQREREEALGIIRVQDFDETEPASSRRASQHTTKDRATSARKQGKPLKPRRDKTARAAAAPAKTGGKRIHHHDENRIVRDERGEDAKRHERRMIAKYGNTDGPRRRHSKIKRTPFRIGR
ncbi:DEAD/DEAH box helicase [Bifidobacterium goeldii]|uniref:DEAD/DEAH box helicase n=1 Tax=Bifidobacterium goeldii TaxID=2306975 RepID=UPI000F7D7F8D|nr:DEAD/DEAH box helicase [Bifidobacterium goeldii]